MFDEPNQHEKHVEKFEHIDPSISALPVPIQYSEQYYNLRAHAEYVQRLLTSQLTTAPSEG